MLIYIFLTSFYAKSYLENSNLVSLRLQQNNEL